MKVNYDAPLITLDGRPFQDDQGKAMTVRGAVITACSIPLPGDEQLDPVAKYEVGRIAVLAHKGEDLTAEQISTAKARVAKGFQNPVLVYLVNSVLEGQA